MSAVDTSRPDGIARRPQFRTHRGHCRSVRRAAAARRAADTLVWTAAASGFCCRRGHRLRRLASTAVAGGRGWTVGRPATARSPPCSGGCGRVRGEGRPSGQHLPQSRTSGGHGRGVRFRGRLWVPGQVGAACGHRRSKCATADAACGHPQPAGGRYCGHPRLRQGRRTLRQRPAGQPAAEPSTAACMSGRERDRKVRHRPAPPWPDRQFRSLGAAGKLASSWKGSAAQEADPLR